MRGEETYIGYYPVLVETACSLFSQPSILAIASKEQERNVNHYCTCLINHLSDIQNYPCLLNSLFSFINRRDMVGYLGGFIIEDCIQRCNQFQKLSTSILEVIKGLPPSYDQNTIKDIQEKANSWKGVISYENIDSIERFLFSLKKQVDESYDAFFAQDKLGKELARSEEERRRLQGLEEARHQDIREREMDEEEKRRKAREEYEKRLKTRKKK